MITHKTFFPHHFCIYLHAKLTDNCKAVAKAPASSASYEHRSWFVCALAIAITQRKKKVFFLLFTCQPHWSNPHFVLRQILNFYSSTTTTKSGSENGRKEQQWTPSTTHIKRNWCDYTTNTITVARPNIFPYSIVSAILTSNCALSENIKNTVAE